MSSVSQRRIQEMILAMAQKVLEEIPGYLVSCSGSGISFVSSSMVSRITPSPFVRYYRLPGKSSRRQVRIFWKQGCYLTRAMEAFLRLAVEKPPCSEL